MYPRSLISSFVLSMICFTTVSTFNPRPASAAYSSADEPVLVKARVAEPSEITIPFLRNGETDLVFRQKTAVLGTVTRDADKATTPELVRASMEAVVAGPTKQEQLAGFTNFLPTGTELGDLETSGDSVLIKLIFPPEFITSKGITPTFLEEMGDQLINMLLPQGIHNFDFEALDTVSGQYKPIRNFFWTAPPAIQPDHPASAEPAGKTASTGSITPLGAPVVGNPGPVTGALSGKAVVLNQSHGWYWLTDHYTVQRSRLFENLEDFGSPTFINRYLIPLLLNAGARVQPVREPDSQLNRVIVDNSDGAPNYVETGTWTPSTAKGFIKKASYSGTADNPFGGASQTRYASSVVGTATASATYKLNVPASGYYNIYISYSSGSNRTAQAHWQVYHSGGLSDYRINEKLDGATWYLLGNFYFEAGAAPNNRIVLLNDTATAGEIVACDAIRAGGGYGIIGRRSGVSGRPAWQEEAVHYLQFLGMLNSTLMSGDNVSGYNDMETGWSDRPQYANWEQARDSEGNNTIYVGWHTNAFDGGCNGAAEKSGTARGTTTYRDVTADASANTINLTQKCHDALIAGIRGLYQSGWSDRGIVGSNGYGESSQGNLGTVAGFFFEGLFHDNPADCNPYKDPKFREIAARAILHGIINYYGGTVYPPEAPVNFRVINVGNNQVRLEWAAGVAGGVYGSSPTGYRVYQSSNGYGFDSGTDTGSAIAKTYTLPLTPGEVKFFRVGALNTAGVSVPTETLAAMVPTTGNARALFVNGFDRNDRLMAPTVASSGIGGCSGVNPNTFRDIDPVKFQSFNYVVRHAFALAAASPGIGFDSTCNELVQNGTVHLADYPMVDWILGTQAEADTGDNVDDTALKVSERNAIQSYLEQGGNLFISGSELAWDFDRAGTTTDKKNFLHNYLKAAYSADDANSYTVNGSTGIFTGLGSSSLDNGTGTTYNVATPDVLTPTGGSATCMTYVGGTGGTAGIQYQGTFGTSTVPGRLVYLGFPFETMLSTLQEANTFAKALNFFAPAGVDNWQNYQTAK